LIPRTQPRAVQVSRLRASLVALLLLAACQPPGDHAGSGSETVDPPAADRVAAESEASLSVGDEQSAVVTAPLPGLLAVMSGLEQDMARLSRGLWRADYDTIAAAARAVATHPKVPPSEAQQIAGVLGPDMAAFKGVDTEVHDLAMRVAELAGEEDMDAIVTVEKELRAGCMACHTGFRTRIREALR
jgi:cytochrome c556